MGHRSHKAPVLDDGAAAHPLDDAAGGLQQLGVRDLQQQVPAVPVHGAQPHDLHLIGPGIIPGDGGEDGGGTGGHLAALGHRQGRAGDEVPLRHGAENAAGGVGGHGAHVVLGREVPLQLARLAFFALFHGLHGGLHNGAAGQRHQLGRVRVGDAVAQSAVGPGVRVIKGQGPHAGHAVPGPGAQPPGAVLPLHRRGGDVQGLALTPQADGGGLSPGGLQQGLQVLRGGDLFAVAADNQVPLPDAAVPGRAGVRFRGGHHQHAVGKELDAHRLPHGDQGALIGPYRLAAQDPGEQHGQQPCGRSAYASRFLRFIHAITPVFGFCRRRQSYFAPPDGVSCPLNKGYFSAGREKSAADGCLRRKGGRNFQFLPGLVALGVFGQAQLQDQAHHEHTGGNSGGEAITV